MATAKTIRQELACPRCGYDQRGLMTTWVDHCPVDGKCSECGLDYLWSEVLMPEKFEPQWCVEFMRTWRRFHRASATTFLQSFRPWVFWSRLKMSHVIRWGRICGYVTCLLWPLVLMYVLAQAGVAVFVRHYIQQELDNQAAALPGRIAQVQARLNQPVSLNTPEDRQQLTALQQQLLAMQAMFGTKPTVGISHVEAICEAVITPLAQSSSGQPKVPVGMWGGYVPPAELWTMAGYITGATWMNTRTPLDEIDGHLLWLKVNLALLLMLPASLVLLPISMRRAKVRWRHVGRVALYSMFIPVSVLVAGTTLMVLSLLVDDLAALCQWGVSLLCRHGWLMVVVWWAAALHWYMRIPHAAVTVLLLMLMCGLLALAVIWAVDPRLAMEMSEFLDAWRW